MVYCLLRFSVCLVKVLRDCLFGFRNISFLLALLQDKV